MRMEESSDSNLQVKSRSKTAIELAILRTYFSVGTHKSPGQTIILGMTTPSSARR